MKKLDEWYQAQLQVMSQVYGQAENYEQMLTEFTKTYGQLRISLVEQEEAEKERIRSEYMRKIDSYYDELDRIRRDAQVQALREAGENLEAEQLLLDQWLQNRLEAIDRDLGATQEAYLLKQEYQQEYNRQLAELEKKYKPAKLGVAPEKPGAGGIKLSRITGETRDLLVSLLTPLKALDKLPALFDSMRMALYQVRDAIFSWGGEVQLASVNGLGTTLDAIMGEAKSIETSIRIDNLTIEVQEVADIEDVDGLSTSINRELGKRVLIDNRLTGRGITVLGGSMT